MSEESFIWNGKKWGKSKTEREIEREREDKE
jgi:hypothetical protein